MPYQIETRIIRTGKWYNPMTWNRKCIEWRYAWDMDSNLYPDEVKLFIDDQLRHSGWRNTPIPKKGRQ